MPTHVYRPLRNPPNWWDRTLVHPLDSAVSAASGVMGALLILASIFPEFAPSRSMDHMPVWTILPTGGGLAVGGALGLTGLHWWGDDVSRGWALEKLGWRLTALGLFAYAVSVATVFPQSITGWLIPLVLGLGAVLRSVSLTRIEEATRRTLADVKKGDE